VRFARLHPAQFTDRLVQKFRLPVEGWRGPAAITGVLPTQRFASQLAAPAAAGGAGEAL
jgi:NAD+ kinase